MNNSSKYLGYIALFSLFGMTGFVFGAMNTQVTTPDSTEQQASAVAAITKAYDFSDIAVHAKAAYVFDIQKNQIIFGKNESAQLPLASITKIPVALLAKKYLQSNELITISESSLIPEGDWGFIVGETWRMQDLLDYTLMTSSNDGITAIAEAIEKRTGEHILDLLKAQSEEIGLSQTFFLNETGLDSSLRLSGAYGSAEDVGMLFTYAYNMAPEILSATALTTKTFTNATGKEYNANNTNKAISELPGLVFGKTGFTDLAGGNLAVVTESEPGHPFVVVVLGSTVDDRFGDVIALMHKTLREPVQ